MSTDVTMTMGDLCDASIGRNGGHEESIGINGYYKVQCHDAQGNLKWEDEIHNLVTTLGKNLALTGTLTNAAQGNAVMGLKGTGTPLAGDTQASHGSWLEVGLANLPTYTAPRKTVSFAAASAGSISSTGTYQFNILSSGTVAGCFINVGTSNTAIDNTTNGVLFSAGDFSSPKSVANTDTLTVTYTASIT
jgi:hypothetical protein